MIQIGTVSRHDINFVADHMRLLDRVECDAFDKTAREGIMDSIRDSNEAYVFKWNGEPLGIFGIKNLPDDGAIFWLLGTNQIVKHKKDFIIASREHCKSLLVRFKYLTNMIYAEHRESRRWLKNLGAEFFPSQKIKGMDFIPFVIKRR